MYKESVTLAFTGASGIQYGLRLLEVLVQSEIEVSLVISAAGHIVLNEETELKVPGNPEKIADYFSSLYKAGKNQIKVYGQQQWMSPVASGSNNPKKMVICPCTTGCLAAIATGISDNLIERGADCVIKEGGKLILAVREMPLSSLHLEHMLKLAKMGVVIMPPNPGFYFNPKSIEDMVDFVVARILDHLGVKHTLSHRWGE